MADTAAPFSNCPALAGRKIMLIEADEANRSKFEDVLTFMKKRVEEG